MSEISCRRSGMTQSTTDRCCGMTPKPELIQKAKPAGKCVVRILGPEVFGLPKREKIKRFDDAFCCDVARLLGKSQMENSRYDKNTGGMVLVGFFLMEEDVRRILCDRLMRYVVVLMDKKNALHGFFAVRSADDSTFDITDFYVDQDLRRKGYGRKMLNAFLKRLKADRKHRMTKVELSVALGNDAAMAFYAASGFRETAREMSMEL